MHIEVFDQVLIRYLIVLTDIKILYFYLFKVEYSTLNRNTFYLLNLLPHFLLFF